MEKKKEITRNIGPFVVQQRKVKKKGDRTPQRGPAANDGKPWQIFEYLMAPRKRPSLRYGRKSVSQALVAPMHQLTPGSGPQRTPRRGAAGPDASSPGPSRLPRVRVQTSPQTPPAQTVEVAPDAHGGQRRPSCVRVCCQTRAPCAALRGLAPRPIRTCTVLVRQPPALTDAGSVRRRAPTTLQTAGRLPGRRGIDYFNCEPTPRGRLADRKDHPEEGSGSLTRTASAAARGCVDSLIRGRWRARLD
ncbi:hypothetical protein EVAR_65927_1 [Eumeta japonica]|uniref:Uncharacterized protein n=1 Tax=Eumeta variegata TaxID=151549 RepID=A0A4C2A4C6_EUMVA|nr:hypothetical protein EVAR_65927_1 [Eumeta japonica]